MEKEKNMNKKAGIPDGIFYLVAMFAVAIICIVGYLILDDINTNFQASSGISDNGKTYMSNIHGKYVSIIDNSFLVIFIGILLGTLIGVWFIRTHPALFYISIPLFAFIIFLSAIYANVFYNFETNTNIADSASAFTIIPFIMDNYVYVITVVIFLLAVLLFAKGKTTNEVI